MLAFLKIEKNEPLEIRLFKMSLLACIGAASLLFTHDLLTDRNPVDMIAELVGIAISFVFFFISSNKPKSYLSLLFLLFVLVLLDWTWFEAKGMGIGHSLYYLAILIIGIIIVDEALKIPFHINSVLNERKSKKKEGRFCISNYI
jgi:hypothetical protein